MKNIGIDIGKKKCFVCVMDDDTTKMPEETNYENTMRNAKRFAKSMVRKYKKNAGQCTVTPPSIIS